VARALGRVYPEARVTAYVGAAAVALIQIPRGAHYPVDVAAGALLGISAEAAIDSLAQYFFREGCTRSNMPEMLPGDFTQPEKAKLPDKA
jgi:hypothetical protein